MEILNPWRSTDVKLHTFTVGPYDEIHKVGHYRMYHQHDQSYLYTYKNLGVMQLAGKNKALMESLDSEKPPKKGMGNYFLYKRAKESLEKATRLAELLNFTIE